jgi:hypothetical protein
MHKPSNSAAALETMMDTDFQRKPFIKGTDLTTRRIAGETLIVPVRGSVGDLDAIYTLNEIGSRVWQLMDEPRTVKEIAVVISAEYDVTEAEAERDVSELLASMEAAGLVQALAESEKLK